MPVFLFPGEGLRNQRDDVVSMRRIVGTKSSRLKTTAEWSAPTDVMGVDLVTCVGGTSAAILN